MIKVLLINCYVTHLVKVKLEYDLIEFLSSILCIANVKQNEKLIESLNASVKPHIIFVV